MTNSPYGTFLHGAATGDAVLLELFECWKVAAGGEAAAKSEHARNRAHARLRQLEERIRETPAQGLTGIVVGAVLALYLNVFVAVVQAFQKLPFLQARWRVVAKQPLATATKAKALTKSVEIQVCVRQ